MDYQGASDTELWLFYQKSDIKAYNELFNRYADLMYRQALRHVKNSMDAEELTMDLFFNIWKKREQLSPNAGHNLIGYLTYAMRNRVINYLRKNIPGTVSTALLQDDMLIEGSYADHTLMAKDMAYIYQHYLDALSPQRRKIFMLHREENMSYTQIAREMNLSKKTVENYMNAALATLRETRKKY
ncbi:RNA polymerase sigma-70 factor [Chitinophaga pendula]|uniref:RNA polymerase sigma-70 factor n=1 Tax=Chitinophaga TaxID=79328 RepID=UPI0012FE21DD|nr:MULTISPECIES: RNA polymerase sigma-70 factor [Chitinophaga]UCJ09934.1 RNA polymerase sigma-70 factor [Chitinophaga pendula]